MTTAGGPRWGLGSGWTVERAALEVIALEGIGEVLPGADLAAVVADAVTASDGDLRDGDVVVVTSKVVSKAEGRVARGSRDAALAGETDRVVARRGSTAIVRTRHGLTLAAAGIDASNTEPGTVVLLPRDPDASARRIRDGLLALTRRNLAVLVSDTAGRAWRTGQTDIAVGAAGLMVLDDHTGRTDRYGNPLHVTAPAVADEVTAAADLVKGKLGGRPVAVVRGLGDLVLPPGQHGPGAAALVRAESEDLFGYGAREAVVRSLTPLRDDPEAGRGFGAPADAEEMAEVLRLAAASEPGTAVTVRGRGPGLLLALSAPDPRAAGRVEVRVEALARAHRWEVDWRETRDTAALRPLGP